MPKMARKMMFPARFGMYSKLAYAKEHVSIVHCSASSRIVPLKVMTWSILMKGVDIQMVGEDVSDIE